MTDRIGLYPGSFDPITNGHIDIIKRSLRVVDKLVIGIAVNVGKTGLFSLKEREKLVLSDIPHHPFKPSLDRLEVNGPYSPQNVVISALSVNIGRNENPTENLKNFLKLISQN